MDKNKLSKEDFKDFIEDMYENLDERSFFLIVKIAQEANKAKKTRKFAIIVAAIFAIISFALLIRISVMEDELQSARANIERSEQTSLAVPEVQEHSVSTNTQTTYRIEATTEPTTAEIKLIPVSEPKSGEVLYGLNNGGSEITITASSGSSCVVLLKTIAGANRLSFYVRAGDTVTVSVPSGRFYVYFASGRTWYGYGEGKMFGENTSYSMDDQLCDFSEYTYTYTLYPVTDGNFSETPCEEDDFF